MNTRTGSRSLSLDNPVTYRLEVAGHLDDHWSDWLGDVALLRTDDATTTVTLAVADQAQLHGILARIRDIGAPLLGLQQVGKSDSIAPGNSHSPGADPKCSPTLDRVLHTERLTLRPATAADADATWAYRSLESVNEWLTGVSDNWQAYRDVFAEPSRLATTVIVEHDADDQPDPVVIGDFMLKRKDAWAQADVADQALGVQAELGWVLDPAQTRLGYATEAVRELLRYCFEDIGIHRVVAYCFFDNETSWRLMERVAMRRETHAVSESLHRSGQWLDTVGYAVLAHEWKQTGTRPITKPRHQSEHPAPRGPSARRGHFDGA